MGTGSKSKAAIPQKCHRDSIMEIIPRNGEQFQLESLSEPSPSCARDAMERLQMLSSSFHQELQALIASI